MNVASQLAPGQSVELCDILVSLPSGTLRVAANIRTGIVYSTNLTAPSFLGRQFTLAEGGSNIFAFNMASVAPDGTETRSRTITNTRLSATSLAALQDYLRNNAPILFSELGFPRAFFVVGDFQRQDNTFTRVSGIIVRAQVPANDAANVNANGATTVAACVEPNGRPL
ncbi:hypothetical protein ONZ45_g2594 [Pleurotus djamor]|nr:hypothetical protein ONZ45_g2594 [Pleurotus djamor]